MIEPKVATPAVFKYDSSTQVSFRSSIVTTVQGNSGGLTVIGGTAASNTLTLQATSNATRGTVDIERRFRVHTATSITATTGEFPYNTIDVPYSLTFSGTNPSFRVLLVSGTITYTSNANAFGAGTLFNFNSTVATSGSLTMAAITAFASNAILSPDVAGTTTNFSQTGILHNPTFTATTSGTAAAPFFNAVRSTGVLNAGWTITTWVGLSMNDPTGSSGTITNMGAVDVAALAGRSSTTIFAMRSAIASGTGKWFLLSTGTANSSILGSLSLGGSSLVPTQIVSLEGSSARTIWMERHTTADTAGNNLTIQAGGATSGATNKNGGTLILAPGASTSQGRSYTTIQGYTVATASGTSDNTQVNRETIGAFKAVANNTATALTNFTIANGSVIAGTLRYSVQVTDGTDYQVEEGMVSFHVTNKAGTIANNNTTKFGNQQSMTAGTLTVTWTITAANPAVLTVNANSSLTPSSGYPKITYSFDYLTDQAVAVQ